MDHPEGIVKDVVYPVVAKKTLQEIIAEFKAMGFDFEKEVQEMIRTSYGNHDRRMLSPVLDTLEFDANNMLHRPVIDALVIHPAGEPRQPQAIRRCRIRQPSIWGEATTACASDSKQFGAYDQHLMTSELW